MSDKITVRVLCEWTLRHVLLMEGYRKDSCGDYRTKEGGFFDRYMFGFCGKEIEVEKLTGVLSDYIFNGHGWDKSWFVPYTLHGKTTDVKKYNFENLKDISSQDLPADVGSIVNENFWELTQPCTPPVKFKKIELTPIDFTGTTRPVGDIFPCNGVTLEVMDEVIEFKCDACYYYVDQKTTCLSDDRKLIGECSKHKRSTGKGCIYVEVT